MGGASGGGGKGGGAGADPSGLNSPEFTQTAYVGTAPQGAGTDWGAVFGQAAGSFAGMSGSHMGGVGGGQPALSHVSYEQPPIKVPATGFALTPQQDRLLRGLGLSGEGGARFLMQQVLSGNPTYGPYTVQQVQAARALAGGRAGG